MVIKLKEDEFISSVNSTRKILNHLKREFPDYSNSKDKNFNTLYQLTGLSTVISSHVNNLAFIHYDYLYVETESARTVFDSLVKVKGVFALWNPKESTIYDIITEASCKSKINCFVIVRPKGKKHLKTKIAHPKKAYQDLLDEEKKGCAFLFPADKEEIEYFLEENF